MPNDITAELLALNQQLLNAIAAGDWNTYAELCDPSLTAFEPEALGQVVEGLDFHRFYFTGGPGGGRRQNSMCSPHVRVMGDSAVLAYCRLTQVQDDASRFTSVATEETRVWQKQDGRWRHVHFHRSPVAKG
jgi:calcium/calmodulin-dependent protein kinase (CaM kinase) II